MIRVALVGAGGMARSYRRVYADLGLVDWVLAVDTNLEELEACKALGVKRASPDFADALADDIDLIDISTPNFLHEEQAVAALKANKHVLLQKPMANSVEAADAIIAASRKSKATLGMYMSSYTNPLVWEIRELVRSGALGQIQSIRARDAHRGGLRAQRHEANWRASREKTGGGSFVQLSIHAINLMQWWLGSPISQIAAYSANQYCPNIGGDDVTTAICRFASGTFGAFDSGYASDGMSREIYGTKGHLNLKRWDRELEIELDETWDSPNIRYTIPRQPLTISAPNLRLDDASNPYNQQRMFIESLMAGEPPHMNGVQGRQDLAVVMAAYESAAQGGTPTKVAAPTAIQL